MKLQDILKDSNYGLEQFSREQISQLEKDIFTKPNKKDEAIPHIKCLVRKKDIKLTPEEIVRQLYLRDLHKDFRYPLERMQVEYSVTFGTQKKRADIVIFDKDRP